jgi:hypothetical protein
VSWHKRANAVGDVDPDYGRLELSPWALATTARTSYVAMPLPALGRMKKEQARHGTSALRS